MTAPDLSNPQATSRLLQQLRDRLFVPHTGGQEDVAASEARFRILRAGRRWGKTELAAHEAIMAALEADHQMVWWVSNSDKNVRRGYRKVLEQLPPGLLAKPAPSESANDRILTFRNGSKMEFYTAGSAGRSAGADASPLTGEGVNFLIVDEAALITEMVWYQHLRPTLSDKAGRALIISTPRGRNWFWKLWKRGQLPGDYKSWHFTSYDNPYIPDEEIEDARSQLPDIVFRQEYLAEFVANAASIFALPEEQVVSNLVQARGWVTVGIDLGKREDFTVISGCNTETRMPCLYDRWNTIRWTEQIQLIADKLDALDADPAVEGYSLAIDSTGLGDVVYDELEEAGYDVIPINFGSGQGNRQKELMVRLLASDIEQHNAFIYDEMLDEMETYEYEITDAGRYKFEAADGHDDKVSAKLLENWAVVHEAPPGLRTLSGPKPQRHVEREVTDEAYRTQVVQADPVAELMQRPEVWTS
jgi:hypothetical protein